MFQTGMLNTATTKIDWLGYRTLSLLAGVVSGLHQLLKLCRHGNGNLQKKIKGDSIIVIILFHSVIYSNLTIYCH